MDERIGRKDKNGVATWPALSISGRKYRRPCTTVGIGKSHFVVIDPFPMVGYEREIDLLRIQVKGMGAPPKGKAKPIDES